MKYDLLEKVVVYASVLLLASVSLAFIFNLVIFIYTFIGGIL